MAHNIDFVVPVFEQRSPATAQQMGFPEEKQGILNCKEPGLFLD
jgi:hypothetical protein